LLKVENLNVSYGIVQTIHDVGFQIKEGECVALLGSNGAGKTTILNTISGLINPTSGSITFLKKPINNSSPSERFSNGLIQVPEGGKIFPFMTVKENLFMGAACRPEAWKAGSDTLQRLYNIFPILEERANYQAKLLSGGERQMLVLGRGFMALPKLLMIDEPSLGLAPIVLMEVYKIMEVFLREGVTILLAEQNVHQALQVAVRGYVLENGSVVLEGSSEDLLNSEHVKRAYLGI